MIITKLKKELKILQETLTHQGDELDYENDILAGLEEPRDTELEKILGKKEERFEKLSNLVTAFKENKKTIIEKLIKEIKKHNEKLEGGDYDHEQEASKNIIKLTKKIIEI